MGCVKCDSEIVLKNGEPYCPSCGKSPYFCWHCHTVIDGSTKECNICGFFECPSCHNCGFDCKKPILIEKLLELQNRNVGNEEIIEILSNYFKGKVRTFCPRGVPKSHARTTIRNILLKLMGIKTKDNNDMTEFNKRNDEINEIPIGETWTIKQAKESGTHGIEWRETSNLAVCMGKAKKSEIEIEKIKFECFERIEGELCPNFIEDRKQLIKKQCPKCKKTYEYETEYCSNVDCDYKIGVKKGEPRKLKERDSYKPSCNLGLKLFKQKEDDNDGNNRGDRLETEEEED